MGVAGRLARRVAWLGLALLALSVAAVLYFEDQNIQRYGNGRALKQPVDAIIVLGSGTDGDGVLGYSSRRRVAAAVAVLKAGDACNLILSGAGDPDHPSQADLMKEYAVGLGASAEALLVEPRSRTTFENLRFSLEIAEASRFQCLAIATDAFHLERARWLASFFGRSDIGLVAAGGLGREPHVIQVWTVLREATAWWYNLAKVVAWEGLATAGVPPEARAEWIR